MRTMSLKWCRPLGRMVYWPVVCALLAVALQSTGWAAPAKTLVQDTLYKADGTFAQGTLLISWPAFTSVDGQSVAAGQMSFKIGPQGAVNVALVPNTGSTPAS